MPSISLSTRLREEYQRLFATCIIRPEQKAAVEQILTKIEASRGRYAAVAEPLNIPWPFVALIHNMESGLNFAGHLHNGDPLSARTVHVPSGCPKAGVPPFTWEQSATDALRIKKLHLWQDWSIPGQLYKLEGYNGWGYRLHHPHVLSPYLWSFSNHYRSGKYVADGTWSDTAVSHQCGAAVLLRRMAEQGMRPPGPAVLAPLVEYSPKKYSVHAEELQKYLNTIPGIFVKVDGLAGPLTSSAFKKVTGRYLKGDPREQNADD